MNPYSNGRVAQRGQTGELPPVREDEAQQATGSPLPPRPVRRREAQQPLITLEPEPVPEAPMGTALPEEAEEEQAQVLTTNRTIMLCCTLAAMCSPFALFLLRAERGSRAIRHHSAQSVVLGGLHLLGGLCCLGVGMTLGRLPVLGTTVSMLCWVGYFMLLTAVMLIRLRLMRYAWRGLRYDLPLLGPIAQRLV